LDVNIDGCAELDVAVKLAFEDEHQVMLEHKYVVYSYLSSRGISGIPKAYSYFKDSEDKGPAALVMLHAGCSIFNGKELIYPFSRSVTSSTP
jgi:hypothetical protein